MKFMFDRKDVAAIEDWQMRTIGLIFLEIDGERNETIVRYMHIFVPQSAIRASVEIDTILRIMGLGKMRTLAIIVNIIVTKSAGHILRILAWMKSLIENVPDSFRCDNCRIQTGSQNIFRTNDPCIIFSGSPWKGEAGLI